MKTQSFVLKFWAIILLWVVYVGVAAESQSLIPRAPKLAATAYILEDYDSGKVLVEHNVEERLAPASLTKIMTTYVAFLELRKNNIALTDAVTVSEKAWKMGGSRTYIEVNSQVSIEDLLKGIIIQSGNDASVALAEYIAGDEATFAELMNQQARRLGMTGSHFTNSTGWPNPEHYMTARDLAILTRVLILEFPDYYSWYAIKEFAFNNITQRNRNKLLWRDASVDGVKTGHTEAAGYCLVTSAKRDNMRLISVVLGAQSTNARANQNQSLLNYGFRFFETHELYKANQALTEPRVWKGETKNVRLGLLNNLYVTIPRNQYKDMKGILDVEAPIMAPVEQGQRFGTINVELAGKLIVTKPLVAVEDIPKGNIFRRMYDGGLLLFQ